MSRRTTERRAAIDRALAHHKTTGLIRDFRPIGPGPFPFLVDLTNGEQVLNDVREAMVFCAALASASQAITRREAEQEVRA